MKKKLLMMGVLIGMLTFLSSTAYAKGAVLHHAKAKNIIIMVPDGMGLADVTAARIFKNGPNGDPLIFETLDHIGYQRTHSANSTVTDSAAAACAWATGEKFNNGEISCHSADGITEEGACINAPRTILEIAKEIGMATGLVTSVEISNATPAAWGAHVFSRICGIEIARQFIEETGVDVIMGGGIDKNSSASVCGLLPGQDADAVIASALNLGYQYASTKAEMFAAAASGSDKLLGLFRPFDKAKTRELFRVDPMVTYPEEEPTLAEMTAAALDVLEENKKGFFLMVEGGQIDLSNHSHIIKDQIAETLAFENAVEVVLDWLDEKPLRELKTLLIVVADHETGGFAVNGPEGSISAAGDVVEDAWTSTGHTAVDTMIWSQGPGSWKLGKAVDNTYLFDVMRKFLD